MTTARLTERQGAVLEFISKFIESNGFSPTTREIAGHFGVNVNATAEHLNKLEAKGRISRKHGMARTIRVVT
jgi:repressor LexA